MATRPIMGESNSVRYLPDGVSDVYRIAYSNARAAGHSVAAEALAWQAVFTGWRFDGREWVAREAVQ